MNEQLYTIPVNDAYDKDCECPICSMYDVLQNNAIDFVMGNSYMEEDVRMETDKIGFCSDHMKLMYKNQNRLGLALMLKTHMDKTIKDLTPHMKGKQSQSTGFFKKKEGSSPSVDYVNELTDSCYVCRRIDSMFDLHISCVLYLYKKEEEFRVKFRNSKGVCNQHYGLLFAKAQQNLSGDIKEQFLTDLNHIYLENMKRVRDDLAWFIDKFDYRYVNEPWKNSKDALPRAIIKTNSIEME